MTTDTRAYQILVIEDNDGDFALAEGFLSEQAETFNLVRARNFRETREILLAGQPPFDVILLDLSLPDKSGSQLIQDIISISCGTPVLVLTGYADIKFGVKSLSMGVSDYLLKDDLTAALLYKSIIYSLERRKAISALETSRKEYSELFQLSPLPIIVFEEASMKFLDVNMAATEEYGYDREECLSLLISDILPVADLIAMRDLMGKLKEHKSFNIQGIVRHRKNEGEIIHVDVQSNSILYQGKRARIVIINNVTERLNHIRAIEEQNEKLREIAWIQSHKVRAPVARILALISLANDPANKPKERKQLLDFLLQSANELDGVIKDITEKAALAEVTGLICA